MAANEFYPLVYPEHFLSFSHSSHTFVNASAAAGNLIISAATIHCLLKLLLHGAGGNTAAEINTALKFRNDTAPIECVQVNNSEIVKIDSKLFVMTGLPIKDEYNAYLAAQKVEEQALNFTDSTLAREIINDWVKNKTNREIGNLILSGSLGNETQFVLVSVNYFSANWEFPFNKSKTLPVPFYIGNDSYIIVDTMNQIQTLKSGEISEVDSHVLLLPYEGNRTSLLIVLPNDRDGVDEVKQKVFQFGFQNLRSRLTNIQEKLVNVFLPKFNFTFTDNLKAALGQLGVVEAFQPGRANFSGISDYPLYLKLAQQESFISVHEEGTQADSGTDFQVDTSPAADIAPQSEGITTFKADHPFVFFILGSDIQDVSFVGRYEVP